MTEKLDTELDQGVIKQTRHKIKPIRFRNDTINKVKKEHYEFGNKRYLFIPFSVDKDTHLRGLKLKISKGKTGSNTRRKLSLFNSGITTEPINIRLEDTLKDLE